MAVYHLIRIHNQRKIDLRSWIFSALAILLIPFGIAWAVTSFREAEPQAAWMGILVFSGLGAVFGILAWRAIFPKEKTETRLEGAHNIKGLGLKTGAALLLAIAIFTLPVTLIIKNVSSTFKNQQQVSELITQHVISDKALPPFVKKTLAYETLYGEYPEKLEERMMQSMFSGVTDEEMIRLIDFILPEHERIQLTNEAASAVGRWFGSKDAYPELQIKPGVYLQRADQNAEELIRWIYKNFSLPPMHDTTVAKFNNGIFSDNFQDYMGTPPDSIRKTLITPAATAIRAQLATVEVPQAIDLKEEISKETSQADMLAQKEKISYMGSMAGKLWIIPIVLIALAIGMIYFAKSNLIRWVSWPVLILGLCGVIIASNFTKPDGIIDSIIEKMAENAPAPAMAIVYQMFPEVLRQAGQPVMTWMVVLSILGLVLIGVAYFKRIQQRFA